MLAGMWLNVYSRGWEKLGSQFSQPILFQYSISIPPENVRKPKRFSLTFSGGTKIEHCPKIG